MPKFETTEKMFYGLMGRPYSDAELEDIFPRAKAELEKKLIKVRKVMFIAFIFSVRFDNFLMSYTLLA